MSTPVATQLITRAKLSANYRIRKAYGGEIASTYIHARNADPQGSLLDKAIDIQAEITRVCEFFKSLPRKFVQIELDWGNYPLGAIASLKYSRYGLSSINGMIVARQRDITNRTIKLTLWL